MKLLRLICCLAAFPGMVLCRDITGTVYSDHGGPSGHGVGLVTLATDKGLVAIHYQKPIDAKFSGDECRDIGAIWTVRVDATKRVLPDKQDYTLKPLLGPIDGEKKD